MTIPSWNEVILVVEESHTNMSKLYDYILVVEESHTNMSKLYDYACFPYVVEVVAQGIGWLT